MCMEGNRADDCKYMPDLGSVASRKFYMQIKHNCL